MVYPINYRRPSRVSRVSSREAMSGAEKQKSVNESVKSGSSGMSHGIPEALSFDRIIAGGVCPVSLPSMSTFLYHTTHALFTLGDLVADVTHTNTVIR